MLLEEGLSSQATEAGPWCTRNMDHSLSANLLGQMDSCSSPKEADRPGEIPEGFRFFMEGQMMPLAVSGQGKKNWKGSFLKEIGFSSKLHPRPPQPQDSLPFLA